ncbi:MAG: glycosyltransferase family 4 protein [Magnetococcus sp. XQGC-1]
MNNAETNRPAQGNNHTPLRIAHANASPDWEGREIRILTEASGMSQQGHQVALLCPKKARLLAAAQARNLPAAELPIASKGVRGIWAMARWLRHHPVDAVITHSGTDTWLTALACRLLPHPPAVIRLRHTSAPLPRNPATHWLYTQGCRHIVTTGETLRLQLARDNLLPIARITSVPTGIDLKQFIPGQQSLVRQQLGLAPQRFVIGILASLRAWKGHAQLLEAVAALNRNDLHLLIIGDGPQRANLEQQIQTSHLTNQVTLTGHQENVVPWLQACDICALPSHANEGIPQALMQAMACGVPVIATPVGGIREIIHPPNTGLLVPPKDPVALAGALHELLDSAQTRDTLRLNALRFARQHFSLGSMLERMEAVIRHASFMQP